MPAARCPAAGKCSAEREWQGSSGISAAGRHEEHTNPRLAVGGR